MDKLLTADDGLIRMKAIERIQEALAALEKARNKQWTGQGCVEQLGDVQDALDDALAALRGKRVG